MACGKPVVATDRGGPRESVIDGVTGFLRADHPHAFAAAMRDLVSMPPDHWEGFSARARERSYAFPWQRFVERIDEHVELLGLIRAASRRSPCHPPLYPTHSDAPGYRPL